MIKSRFLKLISAVCVLCVLNSNKAIAQSKDVQLINECVQALTDVMIHDITSPLVASRDYVYTSIAFYEAARFAHSNYQSYAGQLNGLKPLPQPIAGQQYDWQTAGTTAFYKTSYAFAFSKDIFQQSWDSVQVKLKKRSVPKDVYDRSVSFGEAVAAHILAWAKEDNYIHTRTLPRFTPSKEPGTWQQTPPDYMEAVEPYWNQIRTLVLTKPDEIATPLPTAYKSEKFMAECKELYDVKKKITKDQNWIANFWDCNPFATRTVGHLMYSVKKVTPGGHWMGITAIAAGKRKQSLVPALASFSMVSVALFDAFIACWDVKYKTNYIRPVTAIQKFIDPLWEAVLQTPPFPEYPSGHSVISMASAVVLTSIYGENFSYIDNSEKPYGVENRSYRSFSHAAQEAAISRMYGGIHFREAIEYGSALGKQVGAYVVQRVVLKKNH
ncbi:MAG: vanadium-dependent haloperoxidase [Chitinophagaceae bacterium]